MAERPQPTESDIAYTKSPEGRQAYAQARSLEYGAQEGQLRAAMEAYVAEALASGKTLDELRWSDNDPKLAQAVEMARRVDTSDPSNGLELIENVWADTIEGRREE